MMEEVKDDDDVDVVDDDDDDDDDDENDDENNDENDDESDDEIDDDDGDGLVLDKMLAFVLDNNVGCVGIINKFTAFNASNGFGEDPREGEEGGEGEGEDEREEVDDDVGEGVGEVVSCLRQRELATKAQQMSRRDWGEEVIVV